MIRSYSFSAGLSILLCFFLTPLFSQNTFQKSYSVDDGYIHGGNSNVLATSGGYLLTASVQDNTANERSALVKINAAGDVLWFKKYGNGNTGEGLSQVIEANDGGYLAVGTSNGTNTPWNSAVLLIKTDTDGNLQWEKIIPDYQTNRRNGGNSVVAVPGGYIVSGSSIKDYEKAVLIRINNQGQTVWSKRYSTSVIDHFRVRSFLVSGDTIFTCGNRDSIATFSMFNATTGAPIANTLFDIPTQLDKTFISMTSASNGDLLLAGVANTPKQSSWICRISRTGEVKWSKTYSGVGYWRIIPMAGDHFVITGNIYRSDDDDQFDPALMKINSDGEVIWAYQYGKEGNDEYFSGAVEMPDGGVMVIGGLEVLNGNSFLDRHLLILRTDVNGLVAGCCRQPLQPVVTDYPVTQTPQAVNQVAFDGTLNTDMIQLSDTLSSIDYCPTSVTIQNIAVTLCPGDSIVIDGTAYSTADTVTVVLTGAECDTTVAYDIQMGVNPILEKTILFCAGDSVTIGGTTYTQPATFIQAVPAATGCDTLVNYTLAYTTPAGPTTLVVICPANIAVSIPAGTLSVPVTYAAPTAQSDCTCPGIDFLLQGLASGSDFLVGTNNVCFEAQDQCGNQSSCCFQVTVTQEADDPCDVKVNGCLRFELLRISGDAQGRRTYHMRVQNNCSQALTYAAFQLPAGVVADAPQNNATYTAPSGRSYTVRNPNNAPIHSIRFSAQGAGIKNGESDVFSYTLPQQSAPTFINALVKLNGQAYVETHLNTFNCPVEADAVGNRSGYAIPTVEGLRIFPNPAETVLFVELEDLAAQVRVLNAQGQVMLVRETETGFLELELNLPAGIYWLEARMQESGRKEMRRFVIR